MQTRNKYFLALWENRTTYLQSLLVVYVFLVAILILQNAINQSPNANSVAFKKTSTGKQNVIWQNIGSTV